MIVNIVAYLRAFRSHKSRRTNVAETLAFQRAITTMPSSVNLRTPMITRCAAAYKTHHMLTGWLRGAAEKVPP
eukprot:6205390-Pleurochrysis_carterae.AAC.4